MREASFGLRLLLVHSSHLSARHEGCEFAWTSLRSALSSPNSHLLLSRKHSGQFELLSLTYRCQLGRVERLRVCHPAAKSKSFADCLSEFALKVRIESGAILAQHHLRRAQSRLELLLIFALYWLSESVAGTVRLDWRDHRRLVRGDHRRASRTLHRLLRTTESRTPRVVPDRHLTAHLRLAPSSARLLLLMLGWTCRSFTSRKSG